MDRLEVEAKALANMHNGCRCAEGISVTILDLFAQEPNHEIMRIASTFGGGLGHTYEDVCGALTGGLIAIGYLFGRKKPDEDNINAQSLAVDLLDQFLDNFGSTNCPTLLEKFGEQHDWEHCKKLAAQTTGILFEMLKETGMNVRSSTCCGCREDRSEE